MTKRAPKFECDRVRGRFLQTDPVGYEDDLNLYMYVRNDPISLIDPTGEGPRDRWRDTGEPPPIGHNQPPSPPNPLADALGRIPLFGPALAALFGAQTEGPEFDPGAPSGFGDLTHSEVGAIQGVVDEAGRPLSVVGSAARGERESGSDIEYVVGPSSYGAFQGKEGNLPGIDPAHGIVPGLPNPHQGPSVQFRPGEAPTVVPAEPPPPPPEPAPR